MPDAAGNIKGSGWSREREAGWERAFGKDAYGRRLSDPVVTHDLPNGRVALCGGSAPRPHRCDVCGYRPPMNVIGSPRG